MKAARSQVPEPRQHGLDGVRAVAILLVISTHGLLSFTVNPIGWAIQDRSRSIGADLSVWIGRAFLMPVFFWVSGFLARTTLEKAGLRTFLRQRIKRVLVPFLIVLVPNSLALGAMWDWGRDLTGGRPGPLGSLPFLRSPGLPINLGHLWYLYYLLIVSTGAVGLVVGRRLFARRRSGSVTSSVTWSFLRGPILLVVLVFPIAGLLAAAGKLQLDTPLSFKVDPTIVLFHALFFAWGWRAHLQPGEIAATARHAWRYLTSALGLLVVIVPALSRSADPATVARPATLAFAASAAFTCCATAAFIGLCCRYLTSHRRWVRFVSDASYWCYLLHLPLLVLLQILLADHPGPGALKYGSLVATTLLACLVTYRYIIRSSPLRRFLG